MRTWMNRRRLLGLVVGTLGTAAGSERARAGERSSEGACAWRFVGSKCSGGTTYEYWCYRCCDFTGCNDVYCEWRAVGPC